MPQSYCSDPILPHSRRFSMSISAADQDVIPQDQYPMGPIDRGAQLAGRPQAQAQTKGRTETARRVQSSTMRLEHGVLKSSDGVSTVCRPLFIKRLYLTLSRSVHTCMHPYHHYQPIPSARIILPVCIKDGRRQSSRSSHLRSLP